jgi:parvulin-like peptidyl-prolyl isomerase
MPIMTRMRDSMPTILFMLLIAFLITIVFEWGMDYTGMSSGGSDVVGSINGREVSFKEFSELLKEYTDGQRARTGADLDDNQMKQARDQVWQSIVTRDLIEQEMKRMGITVTDQEIVEWVRGDNPPEDLRQNFVDSTGTFRRDLYEQFLADPNQFIQDPEGVDQQFGTRWLANYEAYLRERRSQEKLRSMLSASVFVSEGEVLQRFRDQQIQYQFAYALFDPTRLVPDSLIELTEDDLRNYYNEHLEQQKTDATRKVKFVHIREIPSASDTADVKALLDDVATRARGGENFLDLVFTYDEKPDSGTFFKHGELNPELEGPVFAAAVDEVVGPLSARDGYHLMKVLDARRADQEFVHASHILFSVEQGADSAQVIATARDVARQLRDGADFAAMAATHSKDPGSAQKGGDLGWFNRERMVKPFSDAAFAAKAGQVVGPVRTQFGWHIIKVHARDSREVKVADILVPIKPSSQTAGAIYDRAVDFAYNAREGDFTREAQSMGFEIRDADLKEKATAIPGLGVQEAAVKWAFENDEGDISDPFAVSNGYGIFLIVESKEAGIRPFDEVKETLRPAATRAAKIKRAAAIAAETRAKLSPGDSLTRVSSINPAVSVQKAGPITLASTIPGIGRDPKVVGTLAALSVGEISEAVEGTRGGYLLQLLSKAELDSASYKSQQETIRGQLLQERRGKLYNEWIAKLKEEADIEDNRSTFFR